MRFLCRSIVLAATIVVGFNTASAAQSKNPRSVAVDTGSTIGTPIMGKAIPCKDGRIGSFKCHNVELLAYLPASTIGGATGADLWGWSDTATNREFMAIGGSTGTAFVETTDPVNPKYLGLLPPHGDVTPGGAQSVKIYKNHAFVGFEATQHGLQVFDLTQLRSVKNPPVVFRETAHYDKFASNHTLIVNEASGFLYAAGVISGGETCGGGLHMMDIRTPTKPMFVGCYTESRTSGLNGPAYVHDAQCVVYRGPDQRYKNREICVNSHGGVVGVADVTDKQAPKTISIFSYPNVGYAHQGWFTEDQKYFFLDDEFDEQPAVLAYAQKLIQGQSAQPDTQAPPSSRPTRTIVFDLTDLEDPVVLTEYYATTTAVDHNLYIRGRYMYQGNYGAGLRIVDVIDPKHPKEVGYLTKAGSAWGAYPFLKNDVVAVSMDTGLFLVRLLDR